MSMEKNCLFCKIIKGEITAHIIKESDKCLAFMDINPISDGHILVITKTHFRNLSLCDVEDLKEVILMVKEIAIQLNNSDLDNWGINYLSNEESIAGQEVMHFHMHIIPKYGKNEGLKYNISNKKVNSIEKIKKILNK